MKPPRIAAITALGPWLLPSGPAAARVTPVLGVPASFAAMARKGGTAPRRGSAL